MRRATVLAFVALVSPAAWSGSKLSLDDRIELSRGLTAEYAAAKVILPCSRKALELDIAGHFDRSAWETAASKGTAAAGVGDKVQITHIDIDDDRIVFQINGGYRGGRHWYSGVSVSVNGSEPTRGRKEVTARGGTSLVLLFHKPLQAILASDVKKLLAPVLDFEKHSATEIYTATLPPETRAAIAEKRAIVGMSREDLELAMGKPRLKSRETNKDGVDVEEWVYGSPPSKITFVTFDGDKAVAVKEAQPGLGELAPPLPPLDR
jgi:hypothetical protein